MTRRFLAVLFAACTLLAQAPFTRAADLKAGDLAPDMVGKTLEREPVLLSKHAGKVVVMSFWATWCKYCLKELPILDNIQRLGKDKIDVIAVNTEERATFVRVARLLKDSGMQLAYDPGHDAQDAYGVTGLPHMVIVGRDGRIIAIHQGYGEASLDGIVADINRAAAQQP